MRKVAALWGRVDLSAMPLGCGNSGIALVCAGDGRGLRPALLLEAGTAKHGPALCGFEGDCGFCAALGARGARFGSHTLRSARAFGLALLAMLGVVLKLLIVKEDLLARGKHKFSATIGALQNSIGEFHGRLPRSGRRDEIGLGSEETCRSRFPVYFRNAQQGPGPPLKKRHSNSLRRSRKDACCSESIDQRMLSVNKHAIANCLPFFTSIGAASVSRPEAAGGSTFRDGLEIT
jgi:hypothetical protein